MQRLGRFAVRADKMLQNTDGVCDLRLDLAEIALGSIKSIKGKDSE